MKLFYFKNCVWTKKIKIVRVKENECKEKRRYDWCASKQKNHNTAWGVVGEPGYGGVHYHTRLQWRKTWPKSSVLVSTSARWWTTMITLLTGRCSFMCPLCLHPIDAPQAQTVFLEENDYRHDGRVASSRTEFRKLSGGRDDESD